MVGPLMGLPASSGGMMDVVGPVMGLAACGGMMDLDSCFHHMLGLAVSGDILNVDVGMHPLRMLGWILHFGFGGPTFGGTGHAFPSAFYVPSPMISFFSPSTYFAPPHHHFCTEMGGNLDRWVVLTGGNSSHLV